MDTSSVLSEVLGFVFSGDGIAGYAGWVFIAVMSILEIF
jgi:hypothetical protein